ncbi:MAG: hypothetical protein M1830_010080 [Pleopsidium flavum]|nr:MAG: hypothetical protein M1830_010080 [Pleopsidium flavum]
MAWANGQFATFLILCPTSFFLGILFSLFPYDYPLLWTAAAPPPDYYTTLETHLRFIHASPPIIPRILHIVIFVGLLGFVLKLYKPSESNMLFDGASLVLYMCGVIVYVSNIVKGLRVVQGGVYGVGELVEGETIVGRGGGGKGGGQGEGEAIGREDSLRVLAASNTILALVLVGVLVLQAGQWYAERKEAQEMEKMRREREERVAGGGGRNNGTHRSPVGKKKH